MKECFICNNEADKKGSHIVPHFLMKRIDNEEGSKERDKELGFEITEAGSKSYFGKAVLPEKLKEVYGEVTEELIANNKIGGIVDYYFCSKCEKNLSVIENEYSKTLETRNFQIGNYQSFENGIISFLFWISILYRLSIQAESDLKLKPKEEKRLKRILNTYLKLDKKEIKADINDADLKEISYKLIRSKNYSPGKGTFLSYIPKYNQPYTIMVDEFIVFIYFEKSHLNGMPQDFYGSQNLKLKANLNNSYKSEYTLGIKESSLESINARLIQKGSKARILDFNLKLDLIHQQLTGKRQKMPDKIRKEILEKVFLSDEKLGVKHTIENQIKIVREVLEKYNT